MAGALIGVVYDSDTGVAKRTIVSDGEGDDELLSKGWPYLQQGESIHVVDRSETVSAHIENVAEAIQRIHGVNITPAPRCVILDRTGAVVDHIIADPAKYRVTEISPSMLAHKAGLEKQHPDRVIPDIQGPFTVVADAKLNVGDVRLAADSHVRFADRDLAVKTP